MSEYTYGRSRYRITQQSDGFAAAWWNPKYDGYWAQTKEGGFGFASFKEAEVACRATIDEMCGKPLTHEGRPLQEMLSNGDWVDVQGTGASKITAAARHFNLPEPKILDALQTGKAVRTGTDWYDKIRFKPAPRPIYTPTTVVCDCGHECECDKRLVMTASLGSSCPDCYDRMSD
jgi:hypothetical protein